MANGRVRVGALQISKVLFNFVNQEVVPGININPSSFWTGVHPIISEFAPINRSLLKKRDDLQARIDEWHRTRKGKHNDIAAHKAFLYEIGYLCPQNTADNFQINTSNVDDEIAVQAGPQLVVPLMNARFTLNATNARWGSLYDALYGTDAISEDDGCEKTEKYNKKRGDKVIAFTRKFLDQYVPLANGLSHTNAKKYSVEAGQLKVTLQDNTMVGLKSPAQFVGYQGDANTPKSILFIHHGLHIEIQIDRPNSRNDAAGIKDVFLESAVTTIVDCEDSIAAVDADDKVELYRNWLGLMKGNLEAEFPKGQTTITRKLNQDRIYMSKTGTKLQLPGRSLLFIRHVGHLLYTDAILDKDNREIPEGILDVVITTLIALHDLKGTSINGIKNSRTGSIYVVKPKQHGPEEVAFTSRLFSRVEDLLQLPRNTLKMGIMDEERRTTLNLSACIREAKDRLVFINTGFLDRTGDDIHTSMEAGPLIRKGQMKEAKWLAAYEKNNVDVGLRHGLPGKAQIGKGMWAMPDMMAAMIQQKIVHPQAGATCAWVPSPTAATLHALHYHQVDVFARQNELSSTSSLSNDYLDDLLTIPILTKTLSSEEIQRELDNNAQSILGYVVRWIDQGIGCSKVPDINNIGLMEDRATLRISSQLIANWLRHKIVTKQQIIQTFQRMARVVDQQNADSSDYLPMAANFDQNIAFQAALELVLDGAIQPNGYTEPILHRRRREFKARQQQQREGSQQKPELPLRSSL
ncbi:unnamed protein product [Rotaria sp. Silwood2]|nr:unnamed protein product [Rotaria sp. Silwood2]CAF2492976.1 unnamed protein product [Rotaria sp. Silwood2]CAF2748318.1 unnamed protein product [Rotaria sp. Silwood2]CAF2875618.1 unnamed protein product [Rotaria sp. Silwood2]CAF3881985.1 unnamed protein product [Rotaria sp. Silwood2]